jgi:hypothetical protein
MKTSTIYELAILPTGTLNTIRQKEPHYTYFSNLTRTIECTVSVLALNGWPVTINYSAVYRSLQLRGKYYQDFHVGGNKVFRVQISRKVLNPALTTLDIEEMPFTKAPEKTKK